MSNTSIPQIIKELNLENGSNYKISVLRKYKDNELLKRVLKMTMDKVVYSFGITLKNVNAGSFESTNSLEWGLDQLEKLSSREFTGNAAINVLETVLKAMSEENRDIIEKIIKRDLRINLGRSSINKVWKGLIKKPVYMRCDTFTQDKEVNGKIKKGTARNISYPAVVQLKADGTYREVSVIDGEVEFHSRSGEYYSYPELQKTFSKSSEDGYFTGELTVKLDDILLDKILSSLKKIDEKSGTNDAEVIVNEYNKHKEEGKEYILPRSIGNGLINSDDIPYDNLIFDVWDFITPEDYHIASLKDRLNPPKVPYKERFNTLKNIVKELDSNFIRVIEHKEVQNLKEALEFTSEQMKKGLEGAILKDWSMVFKDGTSKYQLKLKLKMDAEVRCVGFIEGTPGTKREETFGSLMFENDEGTIKGSVSGFKDDELEEINSNREKYLGKVFTVEFNDITKARGNNYYAFSHPRFIEFRNDKNETDTLEKVLKIKEMATNLK